MNFIDRIKELFSNIIKDEKKYDIIRVSETLQIKDKSKYSKELNEIIDDYIKEYKKLLKKSIISTPEFNNSELNNRINMLISRTTDIFVSEKEKLLEEKSEMKKFILLKKFELYLSDIKKIQSDLLCRLVALKEIKSKGNFLGRNKRTLEREIDDIATSFVICRNQIKAILIETKSYKSLLQGIKIEDIDLEELRKYYNNLIEQASKVLSNNEMKKIKGNVYEKIANIEKKCEEFFFNNPEYINSITSRLEELENEYNKGIKENLTSAVNELEKEFVFYDKYGKIIDDDIKERLYRLKFYIIANDYNLNESNLFDSEDSIAKGIYKEEVLYRIENIIRDKNSCLIELLEQDFLQKDEILEAKEFLKELFKDKDRGYVEEFILKNIYKLQLLVALDSKDQLIKWYNREVNRKNFLGDELNNKYFRETMVVAFDDYIPIETICYVILNSEESEPNLPLVKLYSLLENKLFSHIHFHNYVPNEYYIPEGIKKLQLLDITQPKYLEAEHADETNLYKKEQIPKYLLDKAKDRKTLIFPKSLKSVVIDANNLHCIQFQNGLKSLKYSGLGVWITIPPSVQELEIISEPSKEFKSYLDKTIDSVKSQNLETEIEFFCGSGSNNIILEFMDFKKSIFLNEHPDFIKKLPKAVRFWIQLKEENKFKYDYDLDIKRSSKFYRDDVYKEDGYVIKRMTYLREGSENPNIRDVVENELKEIMSQVDRSEYRE